MNDLEAPSEEYQMDTLYIEQEREGLLTGRFSRESQDENPVE
ncbi:10205_t:CDS:1, partial [Scutellospora calospora]